MARYLLPCTCGRKTPVEPRQAGETIPCDCGKTLEVPTMLAMGQLEPASPEAGWDTSPATWGANQIMALLGGTLLFGAILLATTMFLTRPRERTPEMLREAARADTPVQSLEMWHYLRSNGLDPNMPAQGPAYERKAFHFRVGIGVAAALALAGCVLITIALVGHRAAGRTAPRRHPPDKTGG